MGTALPSQGWHSGKGGLAGVALHPVEEMGVAGPHGALPTPPPYQSPATFGIPVTAWLGPKLLSHANCRSALLEIGPRVQGRASLLAPLWGSPPPWETLSGGVWGGGPRKAPWELCLEGRADGGGKGEKGGGAWNELLPGNRPAETSLGGSLNPRSPSTLSCRVGAWQLPGQPRSAQPCLGSKGFPF